MRFKARQFLLASLITLYGVLTVVGPALHALTSSDHLKAASSSDLDRSNFEFSSHDDCPVCHFLTQGQLAADSTLVPTTDVLQVQPDDDLPLTFPPAIGRTSGPRAPPCA